MIENNKNGILVPVEKPLEIAERLCSLLKEPLQIKTLGKEARKTVVEKYSLQRMVNDLENIYDSILK